jgi:aspartyl-tRNA synthetase
MFRVFRETKGIDLSERYPDGKFPRMSFDESMRRFGNDKPDLRFGMEHVDLTDLVIEHHGGGIPFWKAITDKYENGTYRREVPPEIIKVLRVPAEAKFSRKDVDRLEDMAKSMGAGGLARAKIAPDGKGWSQTPLKKIDEALRLKINEVTGAEPGDLLLFQFGKSAMVHTELANLRVHIAKKMGLIPETGHGGKFELLWVVDPPLFEYDEETETWVAAHHAFTRPLDEHVSLIESDPARVQCYRYDLVLNGFEIGGGSIRLHDPEVQKKVFKTLGIGEREAQQKFGFLLDALQHGAPPHGGIALGWDRVAMLLSEAESLRDVIPFPKTARGADLMTGAPSGVADSQLADLHLASLPKD